MSDRITDITRSVDRAELNVEGVKTTKKKKLFLMVSLCIGMVAVITALSLLKSNLEDIMHSEEEAVVPAEVENFQEGAKRTTVGENLSWLKEARLKFQDNTGSDNNKETRQDETRPEPKTESQVLEDDVESIEKDVAEYESKNALRPKPVVRFTNTNPELPATPTNQNDQNQPTKAELILARKLSPSLNVSTNEGQGLQMIDEKSNLLDGEDIYDDSFDGSVFEARKARSRKKGKADFVIPHGSSIPCALYTQIISDYSGFVTCRVTQDVYSSNGSVLLVERGSLVSGTQDVALESGKGRVFTKWAEIETPNGVLVRIDSLGTGPLGAAGNDVWIDNHYFERFSGAIMLSFVDDALATAANTVSTGDVVTDSSMDNVGNIAAQTLEQTLNIAPTGYSKIGQRINILVVRDIDFSDVYRLENF